MLTYSLNNLHYIRHMLWLRGRRMLTSHVAFFFSLICSQEMSSHNTRTHRLQSDPTALLSVFFKRPLTCLNKLTSSVMLEQKWFPLPDSQLILTDPTCFHSRKHAEMKWNEMMTSREAALGHTCDKRPSDKKTNELSLRPDIAGKTNTTWLTIIARHAQTHFGNFIIKLFYMFVPDKMSNFPPSESPQRPSLNRQQGRVEAFDCHTVTRFCSWDTYKMLPVPTDRIPQLTTIVSLFIRVSGRETPHASACLCVLHGDVRDKSWLITKDGSPYINNVHGQRRFTVRTTIFITSYSPNPTTFGLDFFIRQSIFIRSSKFALPLDRKRLLLLDRVNGWPIRWDKNNKKQ